MNFRRRFKGYNTTITSTTFNKQTFLNILPLLRSVNLTFSPWHALVSLFQELTMGRDLVSPLTVALLNLMSPSSSLTAAIQQQVRHGSIYMRKIVIIFLTISHNICFGCSKEPSHRDGSFEYPQHIFWLRNKEVDSESLSTLTGGLVWAQGLWHWGMLKKDKIKVMTGLTWRIQYVELSRRYPVIAESSLNVFKGQSWE